MIRLLKLLLILLLFINWNLKIVNSVAAAATHPLRPFPFQLTPEESQHQLDPNDPQLAPYCAQRPTAVQTITYDQRRPDINITIAGTLFSDLSQFVAPFLSITDSNKSDYQLPFSDKAKRYLADYLEGRAYYETAPEPANPTSTQQQDILSRLGVFRKLAPQTYQDKLKRAMIRRAQGDYQDIAALEQLYGFEPASLTVHDYVLNPWSNQPVTLKQFSNHWAPLPEDFPNDPKSYQSAYSAWLAKDSGRWAKLWPYVPMFSREDVKGFVESLPEPGQQDNQTIIQEVIHPHLARTYEVSTALSFMLSPQSTHQQNPPPNLSTNWVQPPPWVSDDWWLNSGKRVPTNLGPVCDPQNTISSSGDLAQNNLISTSVHQAAAITNPNPDSSCEKWVEDPLTGALALDDSACYVDRQARYSPVYLKTYTPFLNQIMNRLVAGPDALFNIFKTDQQQPENWPAAGNSDEEALSYRFSAGSAEAGLKQSASSAKFFYKYLGFIQCQKEKLLAKLLPSGRYQPFSSACGLDQIAPSSLAGSCDGKAFAQLNPPSSTTTIAQNWFQIYIRPRLTQEVVAVYAEAEKQTGVPCEVLAGIHFIEAANNPNGSLVSGRPLGTPEPDAGGQIFNTLLETAVYAANHLKGKVGGTINNLQTLITALSRYNGGGNSNCQTNYPWPIPYPNCPRQFEGEDDPYPVNWLDQRHQTMYLLYCADHTACEPQEFLQPGALTVATEYYLSQPK